jgi:glutamate dehydrogenase
MIETKEPYEMGKQLKSFQGDIQKFLADVKNCVSSKDALSLVPFIEAIYKDFPLSLFEEKKAEDLYHHAKVLLDFFEAHHEKSPKITFECTKDFPQKTNLMLVCKNSAFIVDSILSFLTQRGYHIETSLHPIIDSPNHLKNDKFLLLSIELREYLDKDEQKCLKDHIESILQDIHKAVCDWQAMRQKINDAVFDIDYGKSAFDGQEKLEIQGFLQWLDRGYFTFLGYRDYDLNGHLVESLGVLKNTSDCLFSKSQSFKSPLLDKSSFFITKTQALSTVHRLVPMDVILIKKFDENGKTIGERQFFGLFTSSVYNRSIEDIPLLRKRAETLLNTYGLESNGHTGKILLHVLESLPRDEFFQADMDFLLKTTRAIIDLKERQQLALFIRKDPLGHIVSCLTYVPRDRFSSGLREKFSEILSSKFQGSVISFKTEMGGDLAFARVHFLIAADPLAAKKVEIQALTKCLHDASLTWEDVLKEELIKAKGPKAYTIAKKLSGVFSVSYKEAFVPEEALKDIDTIEKDLEEKAFAIRLYQNKNLPRLSLKLYQKETPIVISDVLPILENMGLRVISETSYSVQEFKGSSKVWIHHFALESSVALDAKDLEKLQDNFKACLFGLWDDQIENDSLNTLIFTAQLAWRDIVLLRAYFKYLRQINFAFDVDTVSRTLGNHAALVKNFILLFYEQFDPKIKGSRESSIKALLKKIDGQLKDVLNSNEDRILRVFLNLILSTLRTNYFIKDRGYISLKLDGKKIMNLPLPKPAFEVFVYSPWMEAIHLRGGKVARGGIRWSTRPDFRKEILDLMKAQMVKNTVIIPVGAKGGFVIKTPMDHLSFEDRQKHAIFCYQTMIRGLLDVTDNLLNGRPVTPKDVHPLDEKDPYLVVAADKGTATFSDIANALSADYQFWLGDAFASGGSVGYDHKKMAITSRGAWVAVSRHFREMGLNVQEDPFTVVGVGDMSGDVFGNGMLLSKKIKLIGAFNHTHIFLDPTPDMDKSFAERKRLFNLPRSNWDQYDLSALSKGGMIIDRAEKSVTLTPQVKKLFKFKKSTATPQEIIQTLLKAEVDLLWFGGIGTFVKATTELHEQAGDRINDDLRINGEDLRCKVIGEGANLGMTQRARIEYAARGGRLNTDAIDNSAGVDCSDHEVNIKILLENDTIKKHMSFEKRTKLLEQMTDDVAALSLRNNYLQTQAISMIQKRGHAVIGRQGRFIRTVEKIGKLNRDIEYLPTDKELDNFRINRKGLTRPEISVLLAYGKIFTFEQVLGSSLPDLPFLHKDLWAYFPSVLQTKFKHEIEGHPLKREIIATLVANNLVNRMGPTFVNEMLDLANATIEEVIYAYLIVRESFDLSAHWKDIERLDYQVSSSTQYMMFLETIDLVERCTLWLLRHRQKTLHVDTDIQTFSKGIKSLMACMDESISGFSLLKKNHAQMTFLKQGVPADLAKRMSSLSLMTLGFGIINRAQTINVPLKAAAHAFFQIHERFSIDWFLERMDGGDNSWTKRALYGMRDQLLEANEKLMESVLREYPKESPENAFKHWCEKRPKRVEKMDDLIREIKSLDKVDLSMIFVFAHHLEEMV